MRGKFHHAFFLEHDIFGQHAVDAAAERRGMHMRTRFAARPALEETAGDLVANLHTANARSDFHDFAGAVGQRDEIVAHRRPIATGDNAEIAIIERTGSDLHQYLAMQRFWFRPFDDGERLDAGAGFGQLIGAHA